MSWPATHKSNDRGRYRPFRLLAVLQFGKHPGLLETRPDNELVINSIYELSHLLHMRSALLRNDLDWLQKSGYISGLMYLRDRQSARFRLSTPVNIGSILR